MRQDPGWVGSWSVSPTRPYGGGAPIELAGATARWVVRVTAGGQRARLRLSNFYGRTPLVIGGAQLDLGNGGAVVRFGGRKGVVVPPGAATVSDPALLEVPALGDVTVSLYFPEPPPSARTVHANAHEGGWLAPGDMIGKPDPHAARVLPYIAFLCGIDVAGGSRGALVALGDSITDGGSKRWPWILGERLQAAGRNIGVLNQGISGNRILSESDDAVGGMFGIPGLARLERDVLSQSGVKWLLLYEGINDIGNPGLIGRRGPRIAPEDVIAGMKRIAAGARAKGLKVYGATLTPFENTTIPAYYDLDKELVRQAVNRWVRTGGAFDGVVDFDRALRDPARPARLLPAFDSGDHLHPSDAGEKALGDAVPLNWFR